MPGQKADEEAAIPNFERKKSIHMSKLNIFLFASATTMSKLLIHQRSEKVESVAHVVLTKVIILMHALKQLYNLVKDVISNFPVSHENLTNTGLRGLQN